MNLKLWKHQTPKAETVSHWLTEVRLLVSSSSVLWLHVGFLSRCSDITHSSPAKALNMQKLAWTWGSARLKWSFSGPRFTLGFPEPEFHPGWKPCWKETYLLLCQGLEGHGVWAKSPCPAVRQQPGLGDTEQRGWCCWHPGGHCCRNWWRVAGVVQVCWGRRISCFL